MSIQPHPLEEAQDGQIRKDFMPYSIASPSAVKPDPQDEQIISSRMPSHVDLMALTRAVAKVRNADGRTAEARRSFAAMVRLAAETLMEKCSPYVKPGAYVQTTLVDTSPQKALCKVDVSAYRDAAAAHGLATHGASPERVREVKAQRRAARAAGPKPDVTVGDLCRRKADGCMYVAKDVYLAAVNQWWIALQGLNHDVILMVDVPMWVSNFERVDPTSMNQPSRPGFDAPRFGTDIVPYPDSDSDL